MISLNSLSVSKINNGKCVHRKKSGELRPRAFLLHCAPKLVLFITQKDEKALRDDANTARAGCSKADPQTNTQTDRGDYNTLRSLARSVITAVMCMCLNALTACRQLPNELQQESDKLHLLYSK